MKRQTIYLALAIACTLLLSGLARAQTGGGYDLTWSTIDSGGGNATGGNYTLDGTIGQADAGSLSGGRYILNGGFWTATVSVVLDQFVYLPLILK
jgi:hypothetical protein